MLTNDTAEKMLQRACALNCPVELHYHDPASQRVVIGRARLVSMTEQTVVTDQPKYDGGSNTIPLNRPVSVHFKLDNNRYAFDSSIQADRVKVRFNEHYRTLGLELRRLSAIVPIQRREHFRVSLGLADSVMVTLAQAHATVQGACIWPGRFGTGRLYDLSRGGCSLLLNSRNVGQLKDIRKFFLSFQLPISDFHFVVHAEIRYASTVGSDGSIRSGLEFLPCDGLDDHRCMQELSRAATEYERAKLKRMR